MAYGRRKRYANRRRVIRKKRYGRAKTFIGGRATQRRMQRVPAPRGPTFRTMRFPTYTFLSRFMPMRQLCRFVYVRTISLDPGAGANTSVEEKFYPHHICDPFDTGTNTAGPAQYQEAMSHYQFCTVQGCKITIRRMVNAATTSPTLSYWTAVMDNEEYPKYDLTSVNLDEIEMMAGVPALRSSGNYESNARAGFNKGNYKVVKYSAKKFFRTSKTDLNKIGGTTGIDNPKYASTGSFSQIGHYVKKPVIKLVVCPPNIGSPDAMAQTFQIKMEFIALLNRRDVIIS